MTKIKVTIEVINDSVDLSKIRDLSIKDPHNPTVLLGVHTNSKDEYNNKAFHLSRDYDWRVEKYNGTFFLIPSTK